MLDEAAHEITDDRYEAKRIEGGDSLGAADGKGGEQRDGGHARTGGAAE